MDKAAKLDDQQITTKPSEERGVLAFALEKELIEHKKAVRGRSLRIGAILKDIRDKQYFVELGFESITTWLASPEVNISPGWAWNFIAIREFFLDQHKVTEEKLVEVDYNKLVRIIPAVKSEPKKVDEWLDKAKNLTRADLNRELKEASLIQKEQAIEDMVNDKSIKLSGTFTVSDGVSGMQGLKDDSVDAIVTCPPLVAETTHDKEIDFAEEWIGEASRVLKDDGAVAVVCTHKNMFEIGYVLEERGFDIIRDIVWKRRDSFRPATLDTLIHEHETIIWAAKGAKHNFNLRDFTTDVWSIQNKTETDETEDKPLFLASQIIEMMTLPADMILDPFAGVATILKAAEINGRSYVGFTDDHMKHVNGISRLKIL